MALARAGKGVTKEGYLVNDTTQYGSTYENIHNWQNRDSTDFYSTSGTGIQSWNYTFETVEVSNCLLNISGEGGCISILAVDVR